MQPPYFWHSGAGAHGWAPECPNVRSTVVACEIKHWNYFKIISAAEIIWLFQRHRTCWKIFMSCNKSPKWFRNNFISRHNSDRVNVTKTTLPTVRCHRIPHSSSSSSSPSWRTALASKHQSQTVACCERCWSLFGYLWRSVNTSRQRSFTVNNVVVNRLTRRRVTAVEGRHQDHRVSHFPRCLWG